MIDPDGLVDLYNSLVFGWSPFIFDIKVKRLRRLLRNVARTGFFRQNYLRFLRFARINKAIPYKLDPRYYGRNVAKYCPDYHKLVNDLINELVEFRFTGNWVGMDFLKKSSIYFGRHQSEEELAKVLGNFYRDIVHAVLKEQNVKHFVEDNTWNILYFDTILKLVREAKLVHIYRDSRDVVCSYMTQMWAPANLTEATSFYKEIINSWWDTRDRLSDDSYLEISLENLVSNPKTVLQQICNFWDIEWHNSLLETDLNHSHTGRWKIDLTEKQQEYVNSELQMELRKLGYSQ
jgi:hypothetical protein